MKCLLPFSALLLVAHLGLAQPAYAIDRHADTIRWGRYTAIDSLTRALIAPAVNDRDKVRVLFYWIAKNIRYDHTGMRHRVWSLYRSKTDLARATLHKGAGICEGYSVLLEAMLDVAGIRNRVVSGIARTPTEPVFDTLPNHVWNAVRIDSTWYLLDVTWASPRTAALPIREFYFLPDPAALAATHLPQDSQWLPRPGQQLGCGNRLQQRHWHTNPAYTEWGFQPEHPEFRLKDGAITLALQVPKDVELQFVLYDKKDYAFTVLPIRYCGPNEVLLTLTPRTGAFRLEMNAMRIDCAAEKTFSLLAVDFEF
jgi:hypothetical protein